jgi:hypothetical protein
MVETQAGFAYPTLGRRHIPHRAASDETGCFHRFLCGDLTRGWFRKPHLVSRFPVPYKLVFGSGRLYVI